MAIVRIPDENRTLREKEEIADYLASIGIDYERWDLPRAVRDDASSEEILAFYREQIEQLKQRGGYVMADVIDVTPETPNLDAMLAFHIHPRQGPLTAIEVESGDLIRVPRGTWHWFDLCGDRTIRAIRLFQDQSGWTPHYTDSGVDRSYQPVCMGPSYLPARPAVRS